MRAAASLAALLLALAAGCADVEVVSRAADGTPGNNPSRAPDASTDGRWVVFESTASTLVPGDVNGLSDVFLVDRRDGSVVRVTRGYGGEDANGPSFAPSLSGDGRWIAFESEATNLVPEDANGRRDVFLVDRALAAIGRVSVSSGGGEADRDSFEPRVARAAPVVTFRTSAVLDPADVDTSADWYVHDAATRETRLVEAPPDDDHPRAITASGASPSADGRRVLFAANWCTLFIFDCYAYESKILVLDRTSGAVSRVAIGGSTEPLADFALDPRYVGAATTALTFVGGAAIAGDPTGPATVFLADAVTGLVDPAGVSTGDVLPDRDVIDHRASDDGRFVVFTTRAGNLVAGDTNEADDVFLRDRLTRETLRLSEGSPEIDGNRPSRGGTISGDGRFVLFDSEAFNLTVRDGNGFGDVLLARNPALGRF